MCPPVIQSYTVHDEVVSPLTPRKYSAILNANFVFYLQEFNLRNVFHECNPGIKRDCLCGVHKIFYFNCYHLSAETIFPPVFGQRLQASVAKAGERVSMNVEVTGTPDPVVTWFKDDQKILGAVPGGPFTTKIHGNSYSLIIEKGKRKVICLNSVPNFVMNINIRNCNICF